jgi:hypothetical protein
MDMRQMNEISPASEIVCLCLAAVTIPVVVVGFGIQKVAEFIVGFWRKETWV